MTPVTHPLAMITAEEIRAASDAVKADARFPDGALLAHVRLHEPTKAVLAAWSPGDAVVRSVEVLVVPTGSLSVIEVVVEVTSGTVTQWVTHEGERPALLFTESMYAIIAVKEHPDWQAAMRRRGIEDFDRVQVDPWPAGSFDSPHEEGRRISRCISFLRDSPTDNGYAHPVEGVIAFHDGITNEVLEVVDYGVVPMPTESGSYLPDDHAPLRTDLKPLEIVQPEGPSFTVDGNLVTWGRWSLRVGFDPYEGLVLHQVTYHDGDRARPVLHRASVTEMVVPYGDPGPLHGWKNAFDAGEWGLGRMANSLKLGCDCLGEIFYFDAQLATEQGDPYTLEHAICMHEEDYGILWKHVDLYGGRAEVRRSRRLVVSFIATVGNYEYGFFWYFYLDGTVQLEVKLTGVVSSMAFDPAGPDPAFANVIGRGVAAPHHQHMFSARLDLDVDGAVNEIYEVDAEALPTGPENPWGNAFRPKVTQLVSELGAQRETNAATSRSWRIVNPEARNGLGRPTAYKLVPTMSTPTLLAAADSPIGRRAAFAKHNLWVTPYSPDERRAAGDYPNQHPGGDGLPRWTAADRSIERGDLVVWYSFGVTHFVRPEDWPVMPVEYTGFLLAPYGFFDRNPALDVPPSHAGHCGT
ncbi:MAG: primary-amine oxidase [Actinomycetota bacterium]